MRVVWFEKDVFPRTLRKDMFHYPELDMREAALSYFVIPLIAISVVFGILDYLAKRHIRNQINKRVRGASGKSLTPEYFLDHRSTLRKDDFTGVYILHNITEDLYYVGQGVRVYERLTQHFMGHGNADVYADWKFGDSFEIKVIPLVGSGYQSLNDLERDAIESYEAYEKGYNSTHGNAR